MGLSQVTNETEQFDGRLKAVKDSGPDVRSYRFRILANFRLFENFIGPGRDAFSFVGPGHVGSARAMRTAMRGNYG